ncbi:MAG TPA: hypothetical protein VMI06_11275 [Terriglobia bacterium]|nr:hypothetical protein [Terriglobia bacterium]
MGRKLLALVIPCLLSLCAQGRADFKYAQSSQITGGMMAGMMKFMGHFNKSVSQPMATKTYVKGQYLRTDNADGTYRIIDLNGKRMIEVNPAKQTYSIATFEQLRQSIQQMRQRVNDAAHNQSQQSNANFTMTPKIVVTPTGRTQVILGQNTQEVKTNVALNVQVTNPQQGTQSGTFSTDLDSWIAPSIDGYKEVSDFYRKMAIEIGWTPSSFGMDPRMGNAMMQMYKNGKIPQGLPMLQVISLITAGQAPSNATQQQQQQTSSSQSQTPTTPGAAAAKALGGMFGHFGHKKAQQDQDQQQTGQTSAAPSNQPATNALMEITMRVVSYSSDPIDSSLFQIPAGYTELASDAGLMLSGRTR